MIILSPLKVFVIDEKYNLTDVENIRKFLKKDMTNWGIYQPEINDCDDFAIQMWARFNKAYPNFAFGFAISNEHAFNFFVDNETNVWIIEPQTDKITKLENVEEKYRPILEIL